jgi:hypothetical protein
LVGGCLRCLPACTPTPTQWVLALHSTLDAQAEHMQEAFNELVANLEA